MRQAEASEAWLSSLFTQRQEVLAQLTYIEQQIGKLRSSDDVPRTAIIRRWWIRHHGCCPHCGRELMARPSR